MKSSEGRNAPKIVLRFIVRQITNFITSKQFKKRVMDFLFNVVDDVVTMVYDHAKENSKSKQKR